MQGYALPADYLSLCCGPISQLDGDLLDFETRFLSSCLDTFKDIESYIIEEAKSQIDLIEDDGGQSVLREKMNSLMQTADVATLMKYHTITTGYDYWKALYRYVNNIATLQLKTLPQFEKDKSGSGSPKAANPFLVLSQDVALAFGRLLFERGVSPKR